MWNASELQLIPYQPWRYTVQPTYAPDGTQLTPGTKEFRDGVHFLASDALIAELKAVLTANQANELEGYTVRWTVEQAGEWNVPVWAGQEAATYIRIPKNVWNNPTGAPPNRVKNLMQRLWNEVSQ